MWGETMPWGGLLAISGAKQLRLEKGQRGALGVARNGDILHDTSTVVDRGG